MENTGILSECGGEIIMEWKIKDFFQLPNEIDKFYASHRFYFSGTSWEIRVYPNGETENETGGWIGIYIFRMSTGFPLSLRYSLGFKNADGKVDRSLTNTRNFNQKCVGWGAPKFISRSELMENKSTLIPSDILTVVCTLKNTEPTSVTGSLFSRLQEVSDNLTDIYIKGKKTDLILKVNGGDIAAHRIILETRSPVFAAMFNHDSKENQTGEIRIDDIDKNTMVILLQHMYSGDNEAFTTENVLSVYAAAEKYDLKNIKEICTQFIMGNLSVEWICEVIKFSELYQIKEISCRAREYFKENASKILDTENWTTFARENHKISVELLGTVVKALLPK